MAEPKPSSRRAATYQSPHKARRAAWLRKYQAQTGRNRTQGGAK